jgi:hypothetical protein
MKEKGKEGRIRRRYEKKIDRKWQEERKREKYGRRESK